MEEITVLEKKKISSDEQFDLDFKPKGAIAFFILLVLLGLIIWFGIYFLMLKRV
ncbi:MAG: cytochrome c oxidase subunit 2A [Flavisolibacter sp.]